MSFDILGTGSFLPERIVKNEELSDYVETSDEWIQKRIGVQERHICTTETVTDIAEKAALNALENAGVKPGELDLIIGGSVSADTLTPGLACMVQKRLGATCPAFDVIAACSGFLYILEIAAGFFERKAAKKVLVVCSERLSGLIDWKDRGTCCIFGDGAGAAVLGEGSGYIASKLHTEGGDDVLKIPSKNATSPFYKNELEERRILMNGQETYKFAVRTLSENVRQVMEKAGVSGDEIDLVIPHQANYRIINEARKRLPEIDPDKFCLNIDHTGNTSCASIPILLDETNRAGRIKRGDKVILVAFGGGLSSAACLLKW